MKERQKAFIARLADTQPLTENREEVQKVQERHHFCIDPGRAEDWMNQMKGTMEEMGFTQEIMAPLLEKIRFLMMKMIDKSIQ